MSEKKENRKKIFAHAFTGKTAFAISDLDFYQESLLTTSATGDPYKFLPQVPKVFYPPLYVR